MVSGFQRDYHDKNNLATLSCLLCISTSFQVRAAPERWWKYTSHVIQFNFCFAFFTVIGKYNNKKGYY